MRFPRFPIRTLRHSRELGREFSFSILDRSLGQSRVAVKIVGSKDGSDITEGVAHDSGDLRFTCAREGESSHDRAAQVVESYAGDTRDLACLSPT